MNKVLLFNTFVSLFIVLGGWLMRKAWKIYERVYKEVSTMYERNQKSAGKMSVGLNSVDVDCGSGSSIDPHSPVHSVNSTGPGAQGSPGRLSHSASSPAKLSEAGNMDSPAKLRNSISSDSLDSQLPEEIVARLLGGVSFGFGSFQVRSFVIS